MRRRLFNLLSPAAKELGDAVEGRNWAPTHNPGMHRLTATFNVVGTRRARGLPAMHYEHADGNVHSWVYMGFAVNVSVITYRISNNTRMSIRNLERLIHWLVSLKN